MNYDPDNMHDVILETYKQFATSVDEGKNLKLNYKGLKKALVCGMGGSAFPGDLVNDYLKNSFDIRISRGYKVEENTTKDTLVIISSYSGNTEETLSSLKDALNKGFKIVVITAGGKLLEEAKNNNVPFFKVPGGIQPRSATGYFFAGMLIILAKIGLIEDQNDKLINLSNKLKEVNYETKGHDIAHLIQQRLPIIYSSHEFSSVAKIWKIKFNENAKQQAFFYEFPEINHNELIGWTNLVSNPHFFFIKNPNDHERIKKRMKITKEILEEKKLPITEIEMQGEEIGEQIFSTIILGDWITYYTAINNKIDPSPVPLVEEFKKRLNN
jgi:glucose/mannose-6-phosphate isomerase